MLNFFFTLGPQKHQSIVKETTEFEIHWNILSPLSFSLNLGKRGMDFDARGFSLSLTFSIVSNQQAIVYFSISWIHKTCVCFPTIFQKHAKTCQANITIIMEALSHFHSLRCDAALINEVNVCTKRKVAMLTGFLQAMRKTKKGEHEAQAPCPEI